ncbi:MAG: homoserine kinase [Firmicutes bacterium HGW-Firmicutes-14]|nr:MAG: homoserine kinase [Firmicutes bacterium HGW-Firmicutes-14]
MDTSKMLRLESLDSELGFKLLAQSQELSKTAVELVEILDRASLCQQIKEVLNNNYNLGKITEIYEIFGGYINRSFGIYSEKEGEKLEFFVRKYSKGKQEKEVLLEHNMLIHAKKNGLDIAAAPIRARNDKTYFKLTEDTGDEKLDWYFAVYEFLGGEDKYTWVENELTDEAYASSAEAIATFHNAVKDFDPNGMERVEPGILNLMPTLPKLFKEYTEMDVHNKFHSYFKNNLSRIIEIIDKLVIAEEDLVNLPVQAIQCDCHPGNMKYKDEKVVGIFDFDYAKMDLRIFEIGLALVYFCASWVEQLDGVLHLDRCKVFLEAYNKKLKELGGLPPLNVTEKRYLPEMLNAGNIYLILWCSKAYYNDLTLNPYEYFAYMEHQVTCMNWVDEHKEEIVEMIKGL